MSYFRVILVIIALTLPGCFKQPTYKESPNTSLTVTYNGKEVHRRNARWVSLNEFTQLESKPSAIIIFGADWCEACNKLRAAISQANLKQKVYYVNIDEPWVRSIIISTGIKQIPIMFYLVNGKAHMAKLGPNEIIMWLLINIESK